MSVGNRIHGVLTNKKETKKKEHAAWHALLYGGA